MQRFFTQFQFFFEQIKRIYLSTFYHFHNSLDPLRPSVYWVTHPIFPGAGEGELYPLSVCLMASAVSGARPGPGHHHPEPEPGLSQTIGAGAESRSRREKSVEREIQEGATWQRGTGHRCPL